MASRRASKVRFEFLEHMADAYISAYGATLEECFENAALALFETMTDTGKVARAVEEEVEVSGHDKLSLLYSWLERLLVMFETSGNLYSAFKVRRIQQTEGGYRLSAKVWGEPFNPAVHVQKGEVKAVTYHQMEIVEEDRAVVARFILDL
ncbi:MAG: archease [Candidatus Bathyarchaeia archaeon]